jgi:predicted deacylase
LKIETAGGREGNAIVEFKEINAAAKGPRLLISAGVHGDEYESIAAIHQLLQLLPGQLLRGTVTLVPVVNEAAFWRGDRVAEDGLDLARICPGDPAGSITERAADELSTLIRQADYYIDLHTGGTTMMVAPLAGYTLHPDAGVLDKQRQMARAFNLPIVWGTDYRHKGRSLSIACEASIPAIYCEYEGGGRCNPAGIRDYVDGCLNVIGWLEMIDRQAPPSQVKYVAEDSREGSGHLQVCNPSPCDGLFFPEVLLGDFIGRGMAFGTVVDLAGENTQTVVSEQGGVVIVLRSRPNVKQGDSLVVVMEMVEEIEPLTEEDEAVLDKIWDRLKE